MPMIGYARVSTKEQDLRVQTDALLNAGCIKVFSERESGCKFNRIALHDALDFLRSGDTLVVTRLDRLARPVRDIIKLCDMIKDKNAEFLSLSENIDTSKEDSNTALGRMFFMFNAVYAEFERNAISERVRAGQAKSRARGKFGGNKFALSVDQMELLAKMHVDTSNSIDLIAKTFKLTKQGVYCYVRRAKAAGLYPGHTIDNPVIPERMARK